MIVYELDDKRIREYAFLNSETAEESLIKYAVTTPPINIFRQEDLHAYGMTGEEIGVMVDEGSLTEIEVTPTMAFKIGQMHEFHRNPDHKLGNIRDYIDTRRVLVERRQQLLLGFVKFEYGNVNENGVHEKPQMVSPAEVIDRLRKYPYILNYYSTSIRQTLRKDLNALGINTHDRSRIGEILKAKMSDPQYVAERRKCMSRAMNRRMKRYERRPELKDAASKSATIVRNRRRALRRILPTTGLQAEWPTVLDYLKERNPVFVETYYTEFGQATFKRDLQSIVERAKLAEPATV